MFWGTEAPNVACEKAKLHARKALELDPTLSEVHATLSFFCAVHDWSFSAGQLALVDGRSVYLDLMGMVSWDAMSIGFDEIERIELIRGPGSAVWGANAFNGVVNILTKSPREMKGGEMMLGGGEHGNLQGGARWADARDRWAYKVSGS